MAETHVFHSIYKTQGIIVGRSVAAADASWVANAQVPKVSFRGQVGVLWVLEGGVVKLYTNFGRFVRDVCSVSSNYADSIFDVGYTSDNLIYLLDCYMLSGRLRAKLPYRKRVDLTQGFLESIGISPAPHPESSNSYLVMNPNLGIDPILFAVPKTSCSERMVFKTGQIDSYAEESGSEVVIGTIQESHFMSRIFQKLDVGDFAFVKCIKCDLTETFRPFVC